MTRIKRTEVRLGKQGGLVIPAELRRALGLRPGDRLIARKEDGKIVLEKGTGSGPSGEGDTSSGEFG